jgi:hypothetical protein
MIRKRVPKLLTILAAAACIFGLVLVAPAETPTLSPLPTAGAQPMGNGYDMTCTKANDNQVNCVVTGCPRVHEDLAGDSINYRIGGGEQQNIPKSCSNASTITVNSGAAFNLAFQGCRGTGLFDTNECGAWSDFRYEPPPAPPVKCNPPENFQAAEVPAGQQCVAKTKVKCPVGSPTPEAFSLPECAPVATTDCPPGSVKATVTPPEACAPPANAITMNVSGSPGGNANIAINNSSALPASCAYNAKKQGLGLGPASVDRTVNVPANGTGTIDDLLFPIAVTYNATVNCTGTWDGKQVPLGSASASIG